MQNKILKDIAEIITGFTFRGALVSDQNGKTQVLLAKNINEDGTIAYHELTNISLEPPRTNAFVSKNDVLLSSRGVFRAGVFEKEANNIIVASSVFILRITNQNILPKYLSIYLNSAIGQNSIAKILTGSTIKTILRKTLEKLEVPVPPLVVQDQIIAISNNWNKRESLLNQKINLNKNIAEGAIKQLLTN